MEKVIEGFENYTVDKAGNVRSIITGKVLKPALSKKGYMRVDLYRGGIKKHAAVHRLVCKAFILNPFNKPQVNHIDSDRQNNFVENLEWCTAKENVQHATGKGRMKCNLRGGNLGFRRVSVSPIAKLTEHKVLSIRKLLDWGVPPTRLGSMFGVSGTAIIKIRTGRSWAWLESAKAGVQC